MCVCVRLCLLICVLLAKAETEAEVGLVKYGLSLLCSLAFSFFIILKNDPSAMTPLGEVGKCSTAISPEGEKDWGVWEQP